MQIISKDALYMNKKFSFFKSTFFSIAIIVLLLFSLIFLWVGAKNSTQAASPSIAGVSFQGEYQIGDGEWRTVTAGQHIPTNQGDVTIRGIFLMHNPETGEAIGPLSTGNTVHLYLNHLGGTAVLPGGGRIPFDAENDQFGEDACAVMWTAVPATGADPITIILHNPHDFGNPDAIDEFFEHMSIAPGIYMEQMMLEKGESERTVGSLILIVSVVILGIAVFSSIIHLKYVHELWLMGLMSSFAGGYFLFDAFAVSIWNEPYILNTRALGLCMMFYVLFVTVLIVTQLKKSTQAVGIFAVSTSAITVLVCIATALFSSVKFYDTWFWWAAIEIAVALVLIVCQIISFRKSSFAKKLFYLVGISTLLAFILDSIATMLGLWEGGYASKFAFLAVLVVALIVVLRIIPAHINAAVKARELEAEKRQLKLELQESRISIMLSQMQPHFIFNTLNTIYHLCDINPSLARSTISSFSKYLRNNIDNLDRSEMIPFDKEISFVQAYLDIEKIRFYDELQITFDMPVTNFKIPVLTVQPIVENAVKHGTSKKERVSTLRISTRETDTCYEIEIRDTGAGFDPNRQLNDERKHIGIDNVRQRLKHLCDGTLTIESHIGEGTTATIQIPKKEESDE